MRDSGARVPRVVKRVVKGSRVEMSHKHGKDAGEGHYDEVEMQRFIDEESSILACSGHKQL